MQAMGAQNHHGLSWHATEGVVFLVTHCLSLHSAAETVSPVMACSDCSRIPSLLRRSPQCRLPHLPCLQPCGGLRADPGSDCSADSPGHCSLKSGQGKPPTNLWDSPTVATKPLGGGGAKVHRPPGPGKTAGGAQLGKPQRPRVGMEPVKAWSRRWLSRPPTAPAALACATQIALPP